MKYPTLVQATFAVLAAVGFALAQGVTDKIAPPASPPRGCAPEVDGKFEITVVELGDLDKMESTSQMQKRDACSGDGVLVAELSDSVITDAQNRTGYISSGYQFQFDNPPQAGALYTAGFTRCDNGSLALGGSAVFYQCRSGDFYNLYDRWLAEQCSPIHILVMPCDGEANNDLEPDDDTVIIGTSTLATTVVIPLSDGQPQVVSTATVVNICQIDDGQIQGHTTPCPAPAASTPSPPALQCPDGQVQVTPPASAPLPSTAPTDTGASETSSRPATASETGFVPSSAPPANGGAGRPRGEAAGALLAAVGMGVWMLGM